MARPLPKDLEQEIAGTAKRSEIRSVAIFAFIFGVIIGFGLGMELGGTYSEAVDGSLVFIIGAGSVAALWFLAARRSRVK